MVMRWSHLVTAMTRGPASPRLFSTASKAKPQAATLSAKSAVRSARDQGRARHPRLPDHPAESGAHQAPGDQRPGERPGAVSAALSRERERRGLPVPTPAARCGPRGSTTSAGWLGSRSSSSRRRPARLPRVVISDPASSVSELVPGGHMTGIAFVRRRRADYRSCLRLGNRHPHPALTAPAPRKAPFTPRSQYRAPWSPAACELFRGGRLEVGSSSLPCGHAAMRPAADSATNRGP